MSSSSAKHTIFFFLFFLLFLSLPPSAAQPTDRNDGRDPYARFTPSMAIIIFVLVAALFFMGFFSIYIQNCSEANASVVRPFNGGTGRSRRGMRGLEASVIETFPTMVYSEVKVHKIGKGDLECAVCLNEFEDDETLRLIPKCDHVFHPECIDAWLASHTTCPVCRANLAPEPDHSVSQPTDVAEVDLESQNDGGDSDTEEDRRRNPNNVDYDVEAPVVQVMGLNRTLNRNRTRGSRTRRFFFPRSHSTGHSLVQPCENTDRFTLRLPVDVRKQLMNRKLGRATSLVLPRETSSRRGYRIGEDGASTRGKSLRWLDKSDRWVFSTAPPFISRAPSMKSPKVAAANGEGTSASSFTVRPDVDSSRPPV
ncbi:DNA excision repair protein ERCC-1-like [Hibiscus syriacus]|uniref:RING-type E3 ubiquitin transferase n=1 Tax=Hibiscus syriacus TaxID=106335 RepID=A0A6A3B5K7_HIBSY|nr:E3 ubiquitin-protein ligase ATL6-like [Hibiscus syriacus]KAE8711513.1 DNA excision repair protein ERCC-1-like [Hibiscus syriacus]